MTPGADCGKEVQAREASAAEHTPHLARTCHREMHSAKLELRDVPSVAVDVALIVDGDLRRSRLYRSHEQDALVDAIAATRASVEAKGGSTSAVIARAPSRQAHRAPFLPFAGGGRASLRPIEKVTYVFGILRHPCNRNGMDL